MLRVLNLYVLINLYFIIIFNYYYFMTKKIDSYLPTSYNFYDAVYGSDLPTEQIFTHLFDSLPSKCSTILLYDPLILEYFESEGFSKEVRVESNKRQHSMYHYTLYINRKKNLMLNVTVDNDKKTDLISIDFFYNITRGDLEKQLNFEVIKTYERPKKKSNINLIKTEMGHLDKEEYDLIVPDIDLELNYGKKFLDIHNVIVERLNNKNDKGIILLHGDPGTGKTSYLKFLSKLILDKEILFIPPSMAEMLSEPSIIPFLMENKNSILIIEDAERVISDRETNGSPTGVSNILNLTDGILGDCLNIQIIATFNMKRERIDSALLRKGRLIAEHKFGKLNVDETNKLLKHLGKEETVNEEMVLADIYNIDVELYKTNNKSKIGFK